MWSFLTSIVNSLLDGIAGYFARRAEIRLVKRVQELQDQLAMMTADRDEWRKEAYDLQDHLDSLLGDDTDRMLNSPVIRDRNATSANDHHG